MNDDATARFARAYWRAFRELDSLRLRQWEQYRLTLPQLRVLYHIRRVPGVTGGELAAALGITVSTVSGLVIKLTERGLVARGVAPDDRRQAPLGLTPEGLALIGTLSQAGQVFTGRIAAELGDELGAITAALERVADVAHAAQLPPPGEGDGPGDPPTLVGGRLDGTISAVLPNATFTVALPDGRTISGTLHGKLRTPHTRLAPGDRVTVELSPHDQTRGIIATVEE